jgi:uncharacterized protein (TIGR02118 family)
MGTTTERGAMARRAGMLLGLVMAGGLIFAGSARADEAKGPIKVTVLYGAPKDPAAFETYYAKTHMPMVYAVKGISKVELGKPLPGPDAKPPAFYRITELWFDNPPAMQNVMARPEWKKIVDDVPNFASGGATILVSPIE